MDTYAEDLNVKDEHLIPLTKEWGEWGAVSLFLDRCQVDTPDTLVKATWKHITELRGKKVGKVVDFGAGDGRFAKYGSYKKYLGYEIDPDRCIQTELPKKAKLINRCAFSDVVNDADVCIGNPPFVRNQDLPIGWRQQASSSLADRTGVAVSGLANAWQYFFLLSLVTTKQDGLCALVVPYEWVSRPSAAALRDYIREKGWNVDVYRLVDNTFSSVLTTSSITIVDKKRCEGRWRYFEETAAGEYRSLKSASGAGKGTLEYLRRADVKKDGPRAVRGLSPGTQKVLTLTEGERVRSGLRVGRDVVPCVTTMRHFPEVKKTLSEKVFDKYYRGAGQKCWLIRTDKRPTSSLSAYLNSIPESDYQTSTCLEREQWWNFTMPAIPSLFMSQSFRGCFPKSVANEIGARAVGGVCGVYNLNKSQTKKLAAGMDGMDIRERIVAHSNGLRKIEINQLNALLQESFLRKSRSK